MIAQYPEYSILSSISITISFLSLSGWSPVTLPLRSAFATSTYPVRSQTLTKQFNRAAYRTPPEHISRAIRGKGGHTNSPPNTNIGHQQKDRQHKRRGPTSEPRQKPIKHNKKSEIRKSVETQRVKDEAKTSPRSKASSCRVKTTQHQDKFTTIDLTTNSH